MLASSGHVRPSSNLESLGLRCSTPKLVSGLAALAVIMLGVWAGQRLTLSDGSSSEGEASSEVRTPAATVRRETREPSHINDVDAEIPPPTNGANSLPPAAEVQRPIRRPPPSQRTALAPGQPGRSDGGAWLSHDDNGQMWFKMGEEAEAAGDNEFARASYERAVSRCPDCPAYWEALARVHPDLIGPHEPRQHEDAVGGPDEAKRDRKHREGR